MNLSIREGDTEEKVDRNWEIIASAFGLSLRQFFMVSQVHGDRVVIVEDLGEKSPSDPPIQCDAVITAKRGTVLGIKTADCVPILLFDRQKEVIGAVHAGWRGTSLGISAKAIRTLTERFSCQPTDILAAVGPAIGPCCYQVDETVYATFEGDGDWKSAFHECKENGKWMLDLIRANRLQLMKTGIPGENISSCGICTSCRTDLFFSHRAAKGGTGRQLNFIVLG